MNKWKKLGHIFTPSGNSDWMSSHAAVPFVERLGGTNIKIYFSSRNKNNKSLIGWIIIDVNEPTEVLEISQEPVLGLGEIGFFDEDGVMGCELINVKDTKYLYYIGWNIGTSVPYRNAIGLAIFNTKTNDYKKYSEGPILDRSVYDPCFVASNCVIRKGDQFLMYYLSCIKWQKTNNHFKHHYHIKMATSQDGIFWQPTGKLAIDFQYENEYAISVPRVLLINGKYRMWYSYRGGNTSDTYRVGYAESPNATDWVRKDDQVGIEVSESGWDAEMICYPYIFEHKNKLYMLYNGNDYGKTGFGLAVLKGGL